MPMVFFPWKCGKKFMHAWSSEVEVCLIFITFLLLLSFFCLVIVGYFNFDLNFNNIFFISVFM